MDSFYYELLDDLMIKLNKQNPKRALLEGYVKILEWEGRLNKTSKCIICDGAIQENEFSLITAFAPAHTYCSYSKPLNKSKIDDFFFSKKAILLNSAEINYLWSLVLS